MGGWVVRREALNHTRINRSFIHASTHPPTHPPTYLVADPFGQALGVGGEEGGVWVDVERLSQCRRAPCWVGGWVGGLDGRERKVGGWVGGRGIYT